MHRLIALLAGLMALATPAYALDVDTFTFSGSLLDKQGTLQGAHPHLGFPGSFYAGLGVSYARNPLVLNFPEEDGREEVIVGSQLSTRLLGGYNIKGKVRLDLELPVYPSVTVLDSTTFAMGDIRLAATVPLVTYDENGVGLAIVPWIEAPTGSKDAYLSDGGVGGGAMVAVGGQHGRFGWVVDGGADLAGRTDLDPTLAIGSNLRSIGGLHYRLADDFLVGAEVDATVTLLNQFGPWNANSVQAHLYATYLNPTGLVATLGGGSGVLAGVGSPDFRVVMALAYRSPDGPGDRDLDGLTDDIDDCPDDPEDFDNFQDEDGCPEIDNDKDGILDVDDECPNDPEDFDEFEDADGCPDPDNDEDGILDVDDECPLDPGPPETQGCPDRDGDGIADKVDACPDEPGPIETQGCPDSDGDGVPDFRDKCPDQPIDERADPSRSDGCPSVVVVTKAQIMILEKIFFDYNKASIKPVSYTLLAEVAGVINANADIKLIEVAGHTDWDGSDEYNLKLSQARCESVVDHLVNFGGVERTRLVPTGYGESKPIDTNETDEGRANNRRVEFNILEQ